MDFVSANATNNISHKISSAGSNSDLLYRIGFRLEQQQQYFLNESILATNCNRLSQNRCSPYCKTCPYDSQTTAISMLNSKIATKNANTMDKLIELRLSL
mmetsp:Transcript_3401/g.5101  ORF Transcript_3401/g.5101 Transcript_3401/m.5101 type:complete len:100 (-) Transcript_3401:1941-2240(-)